MRYRANNSPVPKTTPGTGGRARRVLLLTVAIVAMSIADLIITLGYLRSGGMGEANPLARWVMNYGSANVLIVWKGLTVATACGIFIATRRARAAEIGAWSCCLVLTWLSVRWIAYSREIATAPVGAAEIIESSRWVSLGK